MFISVKIFGEIFYCISINKFYYENHLWPLCVMIKCELIILGVFDKFLTVLFITVVIITSFCGSCLRYQQDILRNPPEFLLLTTTANPGVLALNASASLTGSHEHLLTGRPPPPIF